MTNGANMKTSMLRATALSLALGGCALSPVYAGETPDPPGAGSKQADLGAVTGLAVGAVAAGPVGSLGEARANGAALAAQLSRTDQLGLDVSFRTDDDAVAAQAMSPLLKLGALAASMPQAQVCVAGYADPRGSEAYNDELSLRRAA